MLPNVPETIVSAPSPEVHSDVHRSPEVHSDVHRCPEVHSDVHRSVIKSEDLEL